MKCYQPRRKHYCNKGITPLHLSAKNGHYQDCEKMLKQIEDKNPKDKYGMTPHHYAAKYGHVQVCKVFIKNVDNLRPKNNQGLTPRQLAQKYHRANSEIRSFYHKLYHKHRMNL